MYQKVKSGAGIIIIFSFFFEEQSPHWLHRWVLGLSHS